MTDPARAIAFYLPQFHPVPENDAWWGTGFSEWRKVVRGEPEFPGHYQPHLPSDLGYYDLRVPEVREQQAALARSHGIEGFCYYHYWFKGRRVLGRVFREVLATGRPDFPFCVCWANEPWTTAWDGGARKILIPQEYDEEDDLEHIRALLPAMRDPRYITVKGQPLLLVYRVQALPDAARTFALWRSECAAAGVPEPFICKFDTHGNFDDPQPFGCDAAAEFLPHGVPQHVTHTAGPSSRSAIYSYEAVAQAFLERPAPTWTRFPSIFPGWDNSPRRPGEAAIFVGSSPAAYGHWLEGTVRKARDECPEPIVFINAWNEWAEGAHLEPDERFGRAFLQATARVLLGAEPGPGPSVLEAREPVAGPTFSELYFELYEDYVRLQRYTSAVLASIERRVQLEVAPAHEELLRARHDLDALAAHLRRLQAPAE